MTTPIHLASNQPTERFYRGGAKIRAFRSSAAVGERVPEDWVGSTTTLFGESELGLSHLTDGRLLRDEVTTDPLVWLGPAHHARYGSDTTLLVKLLDAGERLPVHVHPDSAFAHTHVGAAHGKAEAWYILDGGTVLLGFRRQVSAPELAGWVENQDVAAMMSVMHSVAVKPGDSVYVPPGLPHAIGAGIFLVEVQEPEDMSVLLEWEGFAIDGRHDGHLGLGFETALGATDARGWAPADIEALVVRGGSGINSLAPGSERYFRAERHEVAGTGVLDAGFSILIILEGTGSLGAANGYRMQLHRGDTILIPYAAGELTIHGQLALLRCRPPLAQ